MTTIDVYFSGTRYPIQSAVCPTWRDVVTRILAMLRSTLNPADYEVRQENGTVMDDAAATPSESRVSFFMRKKGTLG